jgi:anti-anti-sigma factor
MRGEFDLLATRELQGEVSSLLRSSPTALVIDMGGVRFLDAGWSGVIAQLHERVVGHGGGTMRISAVSPVARRVLELCGLSSLQGLELHAPPTAI